MELFHVLRHKLSVEKDVDRKKLCLMTDAAQNVTKVVEILLKYFSRYFSHFFYRNRWRRLYYIHRIWKRLSVKAGRFFSWWICARNSRPPMKKSVQVRILTFWVNFLPYSYYHLVQSPKEILGLLKIYAVGGVKKSFFNEDEKQCIQKELSSFDEPLAEVRCQSRGSPKHAKW